MASRKGKLDVDISIYRNYPSGATSYDLIFFDQGLDFYIIGQGKKLNEVEIETIENKIDSLALNIRNFYRNKGDMATALHFLRPKLDDFQSVLTKEENECIRGLAFKGQGLDSILAELEVVPIEVYDIKKQVHEAQERDKRVAKLRVTMEAESIEREKREKLLAPKFQLKRIVAPVATGIALIAGFLLNQYGNLLSANNLLITQQKLYNDALKKRQVLQLAKSLDGKIFFPEEFDSTHPVKPGSYRLNNIFYCTDDDINAALSNVQIKVAERKLLRLPLEEVKESKSDFAKIGRKIGPDTDWQPHSGRDYVSPDEKSHSVLASYDGKIVEKSWSRRGGNYLKELLGKTNIIDNKLVIELLNGKYFCINAESLKTVIPIGRGRSVVRYLKPQNLTGKNFYVYYMHLSKSYVNAGDYVNQGESIGASGRTGRATAIHVHEQTSLDNILIDPEILMNPNTAEKACISNLEELQRIAQGL